MKKILLTALFLISSVAWPCGQYKVKALVKMKDGVSNLVIHPGTISEINLNFDFNESAKLSPYIGQVIEAKVTMEEKMDFTKGSVTKIENIKVIVPDPLAQDQGMVLKIIKASDCKKK